MTHTPTPWKHTATVGGWDAVAGPTGEIICTLVANNPDNAEFIVRACNSHDELLDALELIVRCDEKGFINLKPNWHNQVRQAIRKAKS